MSPDDPRHGTWAGYNQGCRTTCCREAARLYQKRRLHERRHRVNSLGLRRRIQALACLGWDMYAIARHLGTGRDTVRQWTIHDTVYRSTYNRMADVYDQLSMRFPPEDTKEQRANVTRTKTRARRNGWAPPLAWDNIDDPNETPHNRKTRPLKTEIDPVVVQRVVDGDKLPMTHAERGEAVRRLRARGESFASIEQRHGLKAERYLAKRVAAAGDASSMPHIEQGAA